MMFAIAAGVIGLAIWMTSSYARGRQDDPELGAVRQMKREARNRERFHHGRYHDERMAEDHR